MVFCITYFSHFAFLRIISSFYKKARDVPEAKCLKIRLLVLVICLDECHYDIAIVQMRQSAIDSFLLMQWFAETGQVVFIVISYVVTNMKRINNIICISITLLLTACAAPPVKEKETARPTPTASQKEREAEAFVKFNEILEVSRSGRDRNAVLPKMEELYIELITEYPDVPVAQESYWKLIELYIKDHSPPQYDKAEKLYQDFTSSYPQSGLKGLIDKTLALNYYINKEWERLLNLSAPAYRTYIEEGSTNLPLLIFMYAEANFQLGNFNEAEEGFEVEIKDFSQLNENKRAIDRLQHIKKRRR
jgi:tetratricopeptide (TPR) repeat protein